MNQKKLSFAANPVGLASCVALLVTLSGCVGYVNGPRAGVYVEPPMVAVGFAAQDDYVYYPTYECYYSVSRHQYAYHEGNAWVSRPAPRGVAVNLLLASPSVRMNFHDSPARHHAAVARQYPKNWKPAAEKPRKNSKDASPDDNHRK